MSTIDNQQLILIEGSATYERILADLHDVELEEQLRHLNDFIKIYPDFSRAHNDLAVLYYQTGNSLKALAHYEKAHKLDPTSIVYRKNLADFYFTELEWTGDAINSYLEILKEHPQDIDSLNALGSISLKIGRKEQARSYFNRTLEIDKNNSEANAAILQLPPSPKEGTDHKQLRHRMSESASTLENIAVADNNLPPIVTNQTQLSQAPETCGGSTVQPTTSFKNLFNIEQPKKPESSEDLYTKAMNLVNAGMPNDAIQILETLIEQDSSHALAHNDLGVLYQMNGQLQKSLEQHEIAVSLKPDSSTFQRNLADLLCNGFGEYEAALNIYVKLFGENSYDVETMKAIAQICIETGKLEDAVFFLEKALEVKPWDQEIAEALRTVKAVL